MWQTWQLPLLLLQWWSYLRIALFMFQISNGREYGLNVQEIKYFRFVLPVLFNHELMKKCALFMLLHEIVLTWILEEISFGAKLERKSCEVNFVENEACSIGQSQQNDTLEGCINLCRLGTFGQGCNFTNDNVTACQFLSAELEDEEYREIGKKYGDCYLSSHEVIIDDSLLSHDNQNNYNRQFKHSCWIESGKNCSHISCFTTHNNIKNSLQFTTSIIFNRY